MNSKGMANGKWKMANGLAQLVLMLAICLLPSAMPYGWAAGPAGGFFDRGAELYKAGRYSDAIDSFDQAIKHKEKAQQAQDFIDRIRKETVERIRNKALTGINKANWQSKFYFMNEVDGRVHVGISVQEVFDRDSTNFRQGALDALNQLAGIFQKAENAHFDVELINEVNLETPPDPTLTARQLTAVFSYLSLDSRGVLRTFEVKN
jgi:tetratricopeptide (TPR) repeat protein